MRMRLSCGALLAAATVLMSCAGSAFAATSPTLKATGPTSVTGNSAVIGATINPNGARTTYQFGYGPTSALGTISPTKSAGAGTKSETVFYSVTGLQSGTTYYYDITAQSSAGTVTTKTVTFKTNGPPPAQATTGGAQVVSSSSVTLTGVINPESAATSYYFEIGTAAGSYTFETIPQTVAAGTSPVPVSYTVNNLEPYTTFHYALVATHGGVNSGAGADASFETFPNPVPIPKITQRTKPGVDKHGPYVFTTIGQVQNRTRTPDTLACTGTATVSFYAGRRRVMRQIAALTPTCGFSTTTAFKRLPVKGHKSEQLLGYIRFSGNHYLKGEVVKAEKITLG